MMHSWTQRHIVGLLMVSASACFDNRPTCVPEAASGDVFAVTLHERWENSSMGSASHPANITGASLPPCGMTDLAAGSTFKVRLRGDELDLNECVLPSCSDDFPSSSEPLVGDLPIGAAGSGVLCMNRHRKVRLADDCEVARVVELRRYDAGNTNLEDPPRPGQQPHVVLVRRLESIAGKYVAQCEDPSRYFPPSARFSDVSWRCVDAFAVSLKKQ